MERNISRHFLASIITPGALMAMLLLPQPALAHPRYDVATGAIFDENGFEIGSVSGQKAILKNGKPLPENGINLMEGTDGQFYAIDSYDGGVHLTANDDDTTYVIAESGQLQKEAAKSETAASPRPQSKESSITRGVESVLQTAAQDRPPLFAPSDYLEENLHPGRSVLASTSAMLTPVKEGNETSNDLLKAFDGWSQYYNGTRWSPIVTDLYKIEKKYPEFMGAKSDGKGEEKRPQLGKLWDQEEELKLTKSKTIGIDDEILKTSMAVYQPIARMQRDFLEDKTARDNYLDSALTLRGVAIMAMGFLDKTVGAGLTAIQQQADQNTVQQLLKQISWTTSKLANPDRAQVYRDTDEKIEACLEIALKDGKPNAQIKGLTRKIVEFDCDETCGPAPQDKKYRAQYGESLKGSGNGSYAYCVCCAETAYTINKQYEDGKLNEKGSADEKQNSLVERVFYGTNKPKGGSTGGAEKVTKIIKFFKQTYGDVFLEEYRRDGEPGFRYVFMFPNAGVPRWVRAFRNGCYVCDDPQNCPISQFGGCDIAKNQELLHLQYGICPALYAILRDWKNIKAGTGVGDEEFKRLAEASMGHPLAARDFEAMLRLNGIEKEQLEGPPSDRLRRWMDAFCDASALAAFTKFHTRFAQIVSDHLTLNQQASSMEKSKLSSLVTRVTEQLALADTDISSSFAAEAALTGIGIQNDRLLTGIAGMSQGSADSLQVASAHRNQQFAFGHPTQNAFFEGALAARGVGALGRDGGDAADAFSRVQDPIDAAIDSIK